MDGAAEYAHTCSSSTWRLDAPSLSALRAAANAAGRLRVGGDGSVAAPPRCLVGAAVPEALRRGAPVESGVSAGDEALFTGWFEKQIQLLCGRGADRAGRLRRSDKVSATAVVLFKRFFLSHSVLELDPMTLALCAIFVAGKLEDEFVAAADLAAAVSPDDAAATALAAAVAAAEPAFLAGVRFDLRVAHPHRPLKSLFDACAGAKDPAPDAGALDAMRQRALANCDARLATAAPLLHAPAVLAVAALCRAASASAPLSAADLDGSLRDLFDDALLNDAYALAATLPDPDAAPAEDDTAELKKVRKRVKKFALWRDADKKPKRPRDDSSSGAAPPAKKVKA